MVVGGGVARWLVGRYDGGGSTDLSPRAAELSLQRCLSRKLFSNGDVLSGLSA